MLTLNEIKTFAKLLDKEYAEEIKPILIASHKAIDEILSLVNNDEFEDMCKRCGYTHIKFEHLNFEVKPYLYTLGYYGYHPNDYRIEHNCINNSLISMLGYSEVAYNANEGLMSVFNGADKYRGNILEMTNTITELKKRFGEIKRAYMRFFIDGNGALFKSFIEDITTRYNNVRDTDKGKDDDLYALFNQSNDSHKVKITITIENV